MTMDVSPGLRALWDQDRSMISDHVRRHGVHLTYVSSTAGGACRCCALEGTDPAGQAGDDPLPDPFVDLMRAADLDPGELPPRTTVPFCYTTGLFGVGHAELVLQGLAPHAAQLVLQETSRRIIEECLNLLPGQLLELDELRLHVEEIPHPGTILFETHSFYDRPPWAPVPAYQLVWADFEGRFPWEEGHDPTPSPQERAGEWRA